VHNSIKAEFAQALVKHAEERATDKIERRE